MYLPEQFHVTDRARLHALMRGRPFATLVSAGPSGLLGTHLPTVLKPDDGALGSIECHVARANPHWRDFADGLDALMIFQGAEAYIRPSWYPSKARHGKVVPTWNYATVHAYGRARTIEDRSWLARHVSELSDQQEQGEHAPWATSDAPSDFVEAMLRGIVGIRFEITRLEGKWKMSQNRDAADRTGTVTGLRARGEGRDSEVADLVEESKNTLLR
jgi:transcriptional regulator